MSDVVEGITQEEMIKQFHRQIEMMFAEIIRKLDIIESKLDRRS